MGYIRIAHLAGHPFEHIGYAKVDRFDFVTTAANDVVMMVIAGVKFIPV
jgi:hypothetical protein